MSARDIVQVSVTRGGTHTPTGTAYPTETTQNIGTFSAHVYRRPQNRINVDVAQQGTTTIEPNSVIVSLRYADNPGVSFVDDKGNPVIHETDVITQANGVLTSLTGQKGTVERIRPYDRGLQIDIRVGT